MKIIYLLILILSFSAMASTIKVGSSPVISSAGIYLAQERGYFKELGLDVEITDFANSGADMTGLLASNQLDVGAGNITSGMLRALTLDKKFKLVADKGHVENGKDYIALIVRKDHVDSGRFKTLKDLKGFKLGLTSLDGVSQQIVADKFLTKSGLSSKDVEFVKLSYAEMNVALKSKAIDATIQIEPFVTKAKIDNVAIATNFASEVTPNQQSAAIIFSEQFINKRKDEAQKFMNAYLKGVKDYNLAFVDKKDTDKVINDLKKHIKITDEKVWTSMATVGLYQNGQINKSTLAEDLKWYREKKYLEKDLEVNDIVDNSFAEKAAETLKSADSKNKK